MLRRQGGWRSQGGALAAEQVATLLVVGALIAGLLAIGLPRLVGDRAEQAVCELFEMGEQQCVAASPPSAPPGPGDDPSAGGDDPPSSSTDPGIPPRDTTLSDLLVGLGDGPLSAEEYQELSYEYVRGLLPEDNPDGIYARNAAVTRAYAELYFLDPTTYKWAGMAAFASDVVGEGIRQAEAARQAGIPIVPGVTDFSFTELSLSLQHGNALVYTDIFWQHMAYEHGGMAAIEQAYDDGALPARLVDAWASIDQGRRTGDDDSVWEGNAGLLRYEQEVTLQQGVYDENRKIYDRLSSEIVGVFQPLESPIPGHGVTFQDHQPGGDIGDFDDRWAWIEDSMLPAWREGEPDLTDELWEYAE